MQLDHQRKDTCFPSPPFCPKRTDCVLHIFSNYTCVWDSHGLFVIIYHPTIIINRCLHGSPLQKLCKYLLNRSTQLAYVYHLTRCLDVFIWLLHMYAHSTLRVMCSLGSLQADHVVEGTSSLGQLVTVSQIL